MTPSFVALLGSALLLAGHASADGFRSGITSTTCNLDRSRAQVNNPCPSLYNAECDGNYCRCPRGQVEHANLHRCVPGDDDQDNDQDDLFGDLPFDYVPPGTSIDVTQTTCTAGNDPCPSLHSAVCSRGYCACPDGYMQDPKRAVCSRDTSPRSGSNFDKHDDHDDHDGHDHDSHDHSDHDSWFNSAGRLSNGGVMSLVTSVMVCALMARR